MCHYVTLCCFIVSSMKTYYTKTCELCGKTYETRKPKQIYCSVSCAKKNPRGFKYKNLVMECEWCGAPFTPKTSLQRFCKPKCGYAAYRQRLNAEQTGNVDDIKVHVATQYRPKGSRAKSSVDEVREMYGLNTFQPSQVRCTLCGKKFKSWDKTKNRRCPSCSNSEEFENIISSGFF